MLMPTPSQWWRCHPWLRILKLLELMNPATKERFLQWPALAAGFSAQRVCRSYFKAGVPIGTPQGFGSLVSIRILSKGSRLD